MINKSTLKMVAILLISSVMLLTSSCSFSTLSSRDKAKIESYSQQLLQQTGQNISLKAEEINKICLKLALSQTIQNGLKSINSPDAYESLMASKQICDMLSEEFMSYEYVSDAIIINNDDNCFSYEISPDNLDRAILNSLKKDAENKKGIITWTPIVINNTNSIAVSKEIRDISSGEKLGMLCIVLKESYFSSIYKNLGYSNDSSIYIIDSNGIVVSTTGPEIEFAKQYKEKSLSDKIIHPKSPNEKKVFTMKINGADEYVVYSHIESLNWYIVAVTSID